MKLEELRIGNIINHITGPIVVDVDDLSLIKDDPCEYIGEPLTEQWLLDLGFKKHDNNRFSKTTKTIAIHITLTETQPMVMLCDIFASPLSVQSVINLGMVCESVHEIQNLHFVITGKELTIKVNAKNN